MSQDWCDLGFVPNSRGNKAAATALLEQEKDPVETQPLVAVCQ